MALMREFLSRLLSRKLLVTIGAILAATLNGLDSTHTAIVAVLAGAYVLAEAVIDTANARPSVDKLVGDATKALELVRTVQGTTTPPPAAPVVVNVTSIPPPPAVPDVAADPVHQAPVPTPGDTGLARPIRTGD